MSMTIAFYKKYMDAVQRGYQRMLDSRIVACALVKDNIRTLPQFKANLEILQKLVGGFEVVLFENNSTDGSKEFLQDWQYHSYYYINLLTLDLPPKKFIELDGKERADHMAFCRNQYLQKVQSNDHVDYMLVLDVDLHSWEIQGLASSFGLLDEYKWDAMFSNGLDIYIDYAIYYDSWAFVKDNKRITQVQPPYIFYSDPVRVQSAFGGMGLYRHEAIKNCEYGPVKVEGKYTAEHGKLHFDMINNGFDRLFINPSQPTLRLDEHLMKTNSEVMVNAL